MTLLSASCHTDCVPANIIPSLRPGNVVSNVMRHGRRCKYFLTDKLPQRSAVDIRRAEEGVVIGIS